MTHFLVHKYTDNNMSYCYEEYLKTLSNHCKIRKIRDQIKKLKIKNLLNK